MPPKVSIITVHYNTPEEIRKLQDSMRQFLSPSLYEWIVIDNCSRQDLSSELAGAVYLRMPENLGFGKANNRAVQKAQAPYLFFVNPDCEFIEDCVLPLIDSLQNAAAAGPKVLNPDGTTQLSFGPFLSISQEMLQSFRTRRAHTPQMQHWIRQKTITPFYPDYISGCALMIRTKLFVELGGFDENFFLYEEDVDLCKRILDRKLRVIYVPHARIRHARNRSVLKEKDRAKLEYRKSQIYYYRKHNGLLQNLLLKLYLFLRYFGDGQVRKLLWRDLNNIPG